MSPDQQLQTDIPPAQSLPAQEQNIPPQGQNQQPFPQIDKRIKRSMKVYAAISFLTILVGDYQSRGNIVINGVLITKNLSGYDPKYINEVNDKTVKKILLSKIISSIAAIATFATIVLLAASPNSDWLLYAFSAASALFIGLFFYSSMVCMFFSYYIAKINRKYMSDAEKENNKPKNKIWLIVVICAIISTPFLFFLMNSSPEFSQSPVVGTIISSLLASMVIWLIIGGIIDFVKKIVSNRHQ